jgi:hypothetical protein
MNINNTISALRSSEKLPFTDVLSEEMLNKHIENIPYRTRIFTPDITIFGFLSQVIGSYKSCQSAVAKVIAHLAGNKQLTPSANTAAYSNARSRLPEETLSGLAKESAKQLDEEVPEEWLWRGRQVKLVDGSTVSMPDTPKNQAEYPQPKTQKKGVGFPIARIVAVMSLALGTVLDLAIAPYAGKQTGEHALLRQILDVFNPGDIAMGDSYYASFFLIAGLMGRKVDAIFPIHSARDSDFRKGKRIGKKDHLVQWKKPVKPEWMDKETYANFPDFITVREVVISQTRQGFRSNRRILVTTLLDSESVKPNELASLYSERWLVETNLRSLKDSMQMGILRGKTPEMVRKEIWAHILAYNLVRKIMAQASILHHKKPRELSFKLALQMIDAFRHAGIFSETDETYAKLLAAISYKKIGNRPGRSEPRMVKRRPKPFPRLQKARKFYSQIEIA